MKAQELKELSASVWDKLRSAVQAGEKARAMALIDEVEESVIKGRSNLARFTDLALTALAEKSGEEAVHEVVRRFAEIVWPTFGGGIPNLSAEERLKRRARVCTHHHGVNVNIEEDEEKFTLRFGCTTGGIVAVNNHEH